MMIKNLMLIICAAILVVACKKDSTDEKKEETFMSSSSDTLVASGTFINGNGHSSTGSIKAYKRPNDQLIQFENLKTDNGPLLKVYLSKDNSNKDFIDLGDLKAVAGNFNYEVNSSVNLKEYNHVIIWCEKFSVLFGDAVLKE